MERCSAAAGCLAGEGAGEAMAAMAMLCSLDCCCAVLCCVVLFCCGGWRAVVVRYVWLLVLVLVVWWAGLLPAAGCCTATTPRLHRTHLGLYSYVRASPPYIHLHTPTRTYYTHAAHLALPNRRATFKKKHPPPPGLSLPIAVATPGGCATPFRSPWSAAARALELTLASSPPSPFAVANSPACACACSPHRSSNCRPCFSHVGRQQEPLPKPLRFPPSSRLSYTGMLHLRIPHLHVHAPTCTHTRQDSLDAGTGYTAYMSTSTPLSYARTDVCCIHASILYTQAPPHGPGAAGCPA